MKENPLRGGRDGRGRGGRRWARRPSPARCCGLFRRSGRPCGRSSYGSKLNWELFDRGVEAFTWAALEEVGKDARGRGLLGDAPHGQDYARFLDEAARAAEAGQSLAMAGDSRSESPTMAPFVALRQELEKPFATGLLLWRRTGGPKGDLLQEMDSVLQVPGWTNIWTQPIDNRIDMLSTGVRTPDRRQGVRPRPGPSTASAKEVEQALKPHRPGVPGALDVVAEPIMGKGYLEIKIDREKAARYGVRVGDIQDTDRGGPGRPDHHADGRGPRPLPGARPLRPRLPRGRGGRQAAPGQPRHGGAAGGVRGHARRGPADHDRPVGRPARRRPRSRGRTVAAADPARRSGRRAHRGGAGRDQERERPAASPTSP